jgi:hypothetical protein
MAITVKHSKVSTIPDDADTSLVRPSDWNADHTLTGTIPIANGGTGASTANDGFNALAPSQTGNSGKYLTTNGTDSSWSVNPLGTVTSVAATAGTGISVTGSPITTSGTLNITNTAPDQTVALTAGTGISTSGTYPNFTITNTSPSLGGDVVGPASATDNAVARFDTTTGKLLQNSVVTVGDTGAVTGVTTLAASTSVTTPIVQASNSGGLALKNSAGTTQISMGAGGGDNASINVSTNINGTNAQIDISPTGTGHVHINPTGVNSIQINPTYVGTMDNMTIGATTPKAITGTTITATTFSGSGASLTSIPNSALVNSAITINGTSTSLGGSISVGTVTSVTGTSPVVSSGGATPAISMPAATTSVSGYLTSTDWNTFNSKGSGTVTSVTGTAPVVSSGGATPAISMAAATGSVNGYLTSTDWTTFNNKGSGSVTSVGGTGTVNGISLSGTVTSSGNLTLGGTLSNVSLSTQVTGTLPIGNGGTGQTTANAAYNALSPMTTTGDIEYRNGSSVATRLGIGSTGQVLTVAGGVPSWATPAGGGGISQVVSTTKTDTFTMSSTTFTDITGLSVTITPSSSSSKILIIASVVHVGTVQTSASGIRLMRAGSAISVGDTAGSRSLVSGSESYATYGVSLASDTINYLDSPATTSATTYNIQIKAYSSTAYVNRTPVDSDDQAYYRGVSSITVMEVK